MLGLIIYFTGYVISYYLLRKKWNKDFGHSWEGVISCAMMSILSWLGILLWISIGGLKDVMPKSEPPKWL